MARGAPALAGDQEGGTEERQSTLRSIAARACHPWNGEPPPSLWSRSTSSTDPTGGVSREEGLDLVAADEVEVADDRVLQA